MDDFKKLTEQLLKIYINANAESVNDFGIDTAMTKTVKYNRWEIIVLDQFL